MRGCGVATPETLAIYHPGGRSSFCAALRSASELHEFLADQKNYPLFAKPADGMYSVGALRLEAVEDDYIKLAGGKRTSINEIVHFVSSLTPNGYIFQKVIVLHPALSEAFGNTVATIRLFILWREQGPVLESAVIKIPVSKNVADNFWRSGNMLGAVDHAEGKISRVITGVGSKATTVDRHPETGVPLLAMELPFWHEVVATGLNGAANFPGLRTQSWDISITPAGPIAVEANQGGDLNLHQLAHHRGGLTPSYVDHLKRCGYKKRLP